MSEDTGIVEEAPVEETPAEDAPVAEAPKEEAPAEDSSALMGDDAEVDYAAVELPEGVQMDTEALAEYGPVLKEAGVTAEQAKALFPIVAQMNQKNADAFNAYRETQIEAIKQMPPEDLADAKKAVQEFAKDDPEAAKAINSYKGDEAWLVRLLSRVGKAMGEDKFIDGKSAAADRPAEDILFPSMADKK
jgi:hypothetical protein